MDALFGTLIVVGMLALGFVVVDRIADGHSRAFSGYFAGFRPDGWPVGVQEEYLERPWGSGTAAEPEPIEPRGHIDEVAQAAVPVAPVRRLTPRR